MLLTYVFQLRLILFMLTIVGCKFCVMQLFTWLVAPLLVITMIMHILRPHTLNQPILQRTLQRRHHSVLYLFYVIGSNVINYHLLRNADTSISCDAKFGSRKLHIIVLMH